MCRNAFGRPFRLALAGLLLLGLAGSELLLPIVAESHHLEHGDHAPGELVEQLPPHPDHEAPQLEVAKQVRHAFCAVCARQAQWAGADLTAAVTSLRLEARGRVAVTSAFSALERPRSSQQPRAPPRA